MFLTGGKLQLTGGLFAGVGSVNGTSQINITGTSSSLELNDISGSGITMSRTNWNLENRTGTGVGSYHIRNVAGNNTLTTGGANGQGDWNNTNAVAGNWNIQSDAGKLTFTGGNFYATAAVITTLQLGGAGNGEIDSLLVTYQSATLNIVKSGNGIWTFSNIPAAGTADVFGTVINATPNTSTSVYRGTIGVTAGTLEFKPLATGSKIVLNNVSPIAVSDGASLKITPFNTTSSAVTSASSLTLGVSTGSTLAFSLQGIPTAAPLAVAGFTTNGSNIVSVSSSVVSLGTYTLLTYTGSIGGAGFAGLPGGLNNSNLLLPNRVVGNLVNNTANHSIDVVFTGIDTIRWDGNAGGSPNSTWNISSLQNWKQSSNGALTNYQQPSAPGDVVNFTDSATSFTVNATAAVNPGSMTFSNTANTYTITAATAGTTITSGSLTANGGGNVTFASGGLSISGTTTIATTGDGITTGLVTVSNTGGAFSLGSSLALTSGTLVLNRTDSVTLGRRSPERGR